MVAHPRLDEHGVGHPRGTPPIGPYHEPLVGAAYELQGLKEEGLELNVLGLTFGIDVRHPALKLPGIGRLPE